MPFGAKSLPIPIVSDDFGGATAIGGGWQDFQFRESDFQRMSSLGGARGINSSVMQCIAKLVLGYSAAPLWLYDGEGAPLVNDKIRRLLKRPNSIMGEAKYHRLSMFYRSFGGDTYIKIVRAKGDGTPLELWPYSNGSIRPVPSKDEWISHYEGTDPKGRKVPIPVSDIIHLPWPIPEESRPWKGMAPLFSIAKDLGVLDEITRIVYAVLKNDAVMKGGIFDSKGKLANPEQVDIYRAKLKASTTGEHRGEIGLFTGGMSYTRFALGLQELDLSPIAATNEARVAGAFMVPLEYSGLTAGQESSTYANKEEARRGFFEDTLSPIWQSDADEYSSKLLGPDDVRYFWFYTKDIPGLKTDANALSARVVSHWEKNLIRRNVALAQLDYDPVDESENVYYTDTIAIPEMGAPPPAPKGRKGTILRFSSKAKLDDPAWTEEKALEYFKRYDTPAERTARKLKLVLAGLFTDLKEEALSNLPTKGNETARSLKWYGVWRQTKDDERLDLFDEVAAQEAFAEATRDTVEELVKLQVTRALSEVVNNPRDIISEFDEAINRVLDRSIDKITTSVGTVKEELRELLKANRDASPTELRDLITAKFEDVYSESRAATIARTTATFATGASQKEAWAPFADEGTAIWLSVGDAATRPEHAAADGQLPDEDGLYDIGGDLMEFPGGGSTSEMNINCRCVLRWRPKGGGEDEEE